MEKKYREDGKQGALVDVGYKEEGGLKWKNLAQTSCFDAGKSLQA